MNIRPVVEMALNYMIVICVCILLVKGGLTALAVILGVLAVAMLFIPQVDNETEMLQTALKLLGGKK